jgi:hypothetical protein
MVSQHAASRLIDASIVPNVLQFQRVFGVQMQGQVSCWPMTLYDGGLLNSVTNAVGERRSAATGATKTAEKEKWWSGAQINVAEAAESI